MQHIACWRPGWLPLPLLRYRHRRAVAVSACVTLLGLVVWNSSVSVLTLRSAPLLCQSSGDVFPEQLHPPEAAAASTADPCSDNLLGRRVPGRPCPDPVVDVVYTWVNGSDPEFQRRLADTLAALSRRPYPVSVGAYRFADSDELRYSLRALERHAPWVRHVFLVTSGQVPHWLDLDNPRVTLVTHEQIFPNKSHLPTFSSNSIEAHIHRIPGLAERFLFINDDFVIFQPAWPEDFVTSSGEYTFYMDSPVSDGPPGDPFYPSLQSTDRMLRRRYGVAERWFMAHVPLLLERRLMRELQSLFPVEYERTSAGRVRQPTDVQLHIAYGYFIMSEQLNVPAEKLFEELDVDGSGDWSASELHTVMTRVLPLPLTSDSVHNFTDSLLHCAGHDQSPPVFSRQLVLGCAPVVKKLLERLGRRPRFRYRLGPREHWSFTMLSADPSHVARQLDRVRRQPPKFAVFNNEFSEADEATARNVSQQLQDLLSALFPRPSQFERPA